MNKTSSYFWTDMLESVLRDSYQEGGLAAAVSAIQRVDPTKTRSTIATKACRMRITDPKPRKNKGSVLTYP